MIITNRKTNPIERERSLDIEKIYDLCGPPIYNWLLMRLQDKSLAEDVLQEVMLCAVRHYKKIIEADNLKGYMFRIARNTLSQWNKKRCAGIREICQADMDIDFLERLPASSLAHQQDTEDLQKLIQQAIRSLPEVEQDILYLKFYMDQTFAQIAEIHNIPQGTVSTIYRRALERLRIRLPEKIC